MHGELLKARCTACTSAMPWREDLSVNLPCPHCGRTGTLRPDVVWFGEVPLQMDAIDDALAQSDLFVSIGTSGSVYPAAGFVEQAKELGIRAYEINLEPSIMLASSMKPTMDRLLRRSQLGSRRCSQHQYAHSRSRCDVARTGQRSSWAFSGEPSKRERVKSNYASAAILVTKVSGAKQRSRPSFCDRSRHWNGDQATVPGA